MKIINTMDGNRNQTSRSESVHGSGAKPTLQQPVTVRTTKTITRGVNNLKVCTRTCVKEFSSERCQLPSELDKLLSNLDQSRNVAIKMSAFKPCIDRVDKLEKLMSKALSMTHKFRGVHIGSNVYASVERVRRLLTPSVRMVRALIVLIESTMTESEDETDSEEDSETDKDSESDSENSANDDQLNMDKDQLVNNPQSLTRMDVFNQEMSQISQVIQMPPMPTTFPSPPIDVMPHMVPVSPIAPTLPIIPTFPIAPASPIVSTCPMLPNSPMSTIVSTPLPVASIVPTPPKPQIVPTPPQVTSIVPVPPVISKVPTPLISAGVPVSPVVPNSSTLPTSEMTPLPPTQMSQPRHPEECNTEISRRLSEFPWKTRKAVENEQKKGILNCTRGTSTQHFKLQRSLICSKVKETLLNYSEEKTAHEVSSSMFGEHPLNPNKNLVPVDVNGPARTDNSHSSEPLNSAVMSVNQDSRDHTYSSTDLVKYFDTILTFSGDRKESTELMCAVTDQLSKSSISPLSPWNPIIDTLSNPLSEGSINFFLRPSPLTKVLQQKKKEGKALIVGLKKLHALTKKSMNPIKNSILTTKVKDTDLVHHHAKVFALKMQQSLLPTVGSQNRRVILTAKRTQKMNNLTSTSVSSHATIKTTSCKSIRAKVSLAYSIFTSTDKSVETVSGGSLGKRHSNYVDGAPKKKSIKDSCTHTHNYY